jgi:hypothetical protein
MREEGATAAESDVRERKVRLTSRKVREPVSGGAAARRGTSHTFTCCLLVTAVGVVENGREQMAHVVVRVKWKEMVREKARPDDLKDERHVLEHSI